MHSEVIYFNTKRHNSHLLMTVAAMLATGLLCCTSLYGGNLVYTAIFGILFGGTVLFAIIQLIRTINQPKTGLELDAEGIRFNGSKLGRKIGKISWQDIRAVQTGTADGKKQLLVKLLHRHTSVGYQGLPIHAKALDINFYEMEALILLFYHRYHERQTMT